MNMTLNREFGQTLGLISMLSGLGWTCTRGTMHWDLGFRPLDVAAAAAAVGSWQLSQNHEHFQSSIQRAQPEPGYRLETGCCFHSIAADGPLVGQLG